MGIHLQVFELAAKLGSLEGYVWERPDASPRYFTNWFGNIETMYGALPQDVKTDFRPKYREVLASVVKHLEKILQPEDENLQCMKRLLAAVSD